MKSFLTTAILMLAFLAQAHGASEFCAGRTESAGKIMISNDKVLTITASEGNEKVLKINSIKEESDGNATYTKIEGDGYMLSIQAIDKNEANIAFNHSNGQLDALKEISELECPKELRK